MDTDNKQGLPVEAPDAATIVVGSDRYPATIVRQTLCYVWLRSDDFRRTDKAGPYTEQQDYMFIAAPNGRVRKYWFPQGARRYSNSRGGYTILIGRRDAHLDPHK
jgi:hypothetical protein